MCAISFSVSKLKKEQHRQRSYRYTQEYRVCISIERFLSGDCYSLKRTFFKGLIAPRTHCRVAKAKVMTTRTSCKTHISFLLTSMSHRMNLLNRTVCALSHIRIYLPTSDYSRELLVLCRPAARHSASGHSRELRRIYRSDRSLTESSRS